MDHFRYMHFVIEVIQLKAGKYTLLYVYPPLERESVWISLLYNWLIDKHTSALLGLGLLLMTACMDCQALSDMQQLQLRTELVSFQCPSCNSHIFCRERQYCSLVMLSCWLQTDLLLDTEMNSLNAKNEILLS